jgi:hypothetical protein
VSILKGILFSITICNVNQVSRAFLNSIDVKSDEEAKIIFGEFIDGDSKLWLDYVQTGVKNPVFEQNLQRIKPSLDKLRNLYNWTDTTSFVKTANQG